MERKDVVKKVAKLIALAGNNPSEAEARRALLKAQELCSKHGIDHAEISKKETEDLVKLMVGTKRVIRTWERNIMAVLKHNFPVDVVLSSWGNRKQEWVVLGSSGDVQSFKIIYSFVVSSFTMLQKEAVWEYYKNNRCERDSTTTSRVKNDYLYGFVKGLDEAFKAQVEERGLIVVTPSAVKQFTYEQFPNMRSISARGLATHGDRETRNKGIRDGKSMNNR